MLSVLSLHVDATVGLTNVAGGAGGGAGGNSGDGGGSGLGGDTPGFDGGGGGKGEGGDPGGGSLGGHGGAGGGGGAGGAGGGVNGLGANGGGGGRSPLTPVKVQLSMLRLPPNRSTWSRSTRLLKCTAGDPEMTTKRWDPSTDELRVAISETPLIQSSLAPAAESKTIGCITYSPLSTSICTA